ncbi:MAG: hypothetical protein LBE09_05665 [Christensenellaceae bacterium]|jgi:hypothetical protein|nr:hypothetical protein [Christensenellaceae bacterium]
MKIIYHPRPDASRKRFRSLDGEWLCEVSKSNAEHTRYINGDLIDRATVPNIIYLHSDNETPDDKLGVWYKREFWLEENDLCGQILLNFLGVSESANIYINDIPIATHTLAQTPFSTDITSVVHAGSNKLVVNAFRNRDGTLNPNYRFLGIWRSVWLEFTNGAYLTQLRTNVRNDGASFLMSGATVGTSGSLIIDVSSDGRRISTQKYTGISGKFTLSLPLKEPVMMWSPQMPRIYDLKYKLIDKDGRVLDEIDSYFAFRPLQFDKGAIYVGGRKTPIRAISINEKIFDDNTGHLETRAKKMFALTISMGFNAIVVPISSLSPIARYCADKLGIMIFENGMWHGLNLNMPGVLKDIANQISGIAAFEACSPSVIARDTLGEFHGSEVYTKYLYDIVKFAAPNTAVISGGGLIQTCDIAEYRADCYDPNGVLNLLLGDYHTKIGRDKKHASNKIVQQLPKNIENIPKLLTHFNCGIPPHRNIKGEYDFIKRYAGVLRAVSSAGAAGFIFDTLIDDANFEIGLFDAELTPKLSLSCAEAIKRLNKS